MGKLLSTITLLFFSVATNATDTFDISTGYLTVPSVIVDNKKYTNLVVELGEVISVGKAIPLEDSETTIRPDTLDLKRGHLIIPAVIAGDKEYQNLRVTVKEVISYDANYELVAESGFNGEWHPEPYLLFVAEDLPSTVTDGVTRTLDAGIDLWGNFGPMEYWILGTDSSAALKLQSAYCDRRVTQQHQTEQECKEEQDQRRFNGSNYFEFYLQLALAAIEEDVPRGNTGVNGKRENGFQLIIGSAPWSLMDRTFRNGTWTPSGHANTPLHEYWHVINFSHISNLGPTSGKPAGGMPASKTGPMWFIEGGATYMASFGMAKLTASGKLPKDIYGNFWNHWEHMRDRMNNGMELKAQYPNTDLGDYDNETGRDAAYSLGAWGIAFLLDKINNQHALLDIMFPNLQELGWEGAFQLTFGLSSSDFYLEFEEFLNLSIEEQVKILPTIEGSY